MIYYTADLHFGSNDQLKKRTMQFSTIEEMDDTLIRNWNQTVTEDDTVYLVGDVGDHGLPFPGEFVSQLKGHKHLIRGNHDTGYTPQDQLLDYFETVTDFNEIDDQGYHITLCHYPLVYVQRGYMIHGHIHCPEGTTREMLNNLERVLNAGTELNGFCPVTLKELIENNAVFFGNAGRGAMQNVKPGRRWKADFQPLPVKK